MEHKKQISEDRLLLLLLITAVFTACTCDEQRKIDRASAGGQAKDGTHVLSKNGTQVLSKNGTQMLSKNGTQVLSKDGTQVLSKDDIQTLSKNVTHALSKGGNQTLSKDELGERIKELLEKRPKRPDGQDFELEFKFFFGELDSLSHKLPDDFEFDVRLYGPPEGHPTQRNKKAMECLRSESQLTHFIQHVHEILRELKEEHLDDLNDSKENDDALTSKEKDDKLTSKEKDDKLNSKEKDDKLNSKEKDDKLNSKEKDDKLNSEEKDDKLNSEEKDDKLNFDKNDFKITDDSENNPTTNSRITDTTTEPPNSKHDSEENSTVEDNTKQHDLGNDDYYIRRKRNRNVEAFDLDEVLDKLRDDDIECLVGFVSEGDKRFLCRRFTHWSSGIFAKIMAAGAACDDYLINDDDDKDVDLNESHQMAIFKLFKEKESEEVSDDDVKKLLQLAPDVIDDDFIEDLPDDLFKLNLHKLGKIAAGRTTNPRLRYALRKRLDDLDLSKLSSDDVREIGPGLLSLNLNKIQALSGKLFLELENDDLFDDDDSHKDDDDDDDEIDIKRAIGLRIKETIRQSGLQTHQIGRSMRYLRSEISFVHSVEPDDLLDALDDIREIDYDFDDAHAVLYRMTQSSRFPPASMLSGQNLTHIGKLLRGMDVELLSELRKEVLDDALDDISDIDFDDYQAYQLLENMGYTSDLENMENIDALKVRRLGTLFRGMPTGNIALMKEEAIEEALDDLDDLDLSDALKKTIVDKVRQNEKLSAKVLSLKTFAGVISLDDLEDFDDDDLQFHLTNSSHIKWRPPQAALLAQRYKMAKGARRMRPSNLAQMKLLALGLLPDDLDEIMATHDDVLDVAEELKDLHEDLTSGQIDELVKNFIELSGLGKKQVVVNESEAMQGAHIMAYLQPELFDKLEFTIAGKVAFVYQVAKIPSHKMSRQHVQFLAKKMLDMLQDTDSAESPNEIVENRESRRLRSLGHMALGLTSLQISTISGRAIIDNLGMLRNLALTKGQAKAIFEKIENAVKNWKCDSNILARVGPLLQYHDDPFSDECDTTFEADQLDTFLAVVKDFEKRRNVIQQRLDEGFAREDDDGTTDDAGEKILVDAVVATFVATQKINSRNRRAVHVSAGPLTCDILIRLGRAARHVDLHYMKTISNEELKRCLPQLGTVGGWSQEVLASLATRIKSIYGDVSTWSSQTVAAAGSIVAGLSAAEIQTLNGLNGVDVMQSIGRHRKLSTDQLKAGFRRWMELNKKKDVLNITGGEFSSLSEFVCGLEVAEIARLKDVTFKRSLNTIGQSSSCTQEQRQAYLSKAQDVYGSQIGQWTPAVVADMGYLLGALSGDHIKMLNSKQLALISPKMIETVPKDKMAAMSTNQLMSFSTNQANAVTAGQYQALTAEQQKIVHSKASVDFNKPAGLDGNTGSGNALRDTYWGILILATAHLAAMVM